MPSATCFRRTRSAGRMSKAVGRMRQSGSAMRGGALPGGVPSRKGAPVRAERVPEPRDAILIGEASCGIGAMSRVHIKNVPQMPPPFSAPRPPR